MYPKACATTIGVFSSWDKAEAAVDESRAAGFSDSEIGVVARNRNDETGYRRVDSSDMDEDDDAAEVGSGALAGAVAGAGIGGLVGLGVLAGTIPVVGPALFAGTLGVLASNAAGGAAVAGVVGALTAWGMSEDDARHYEGEIAAGRVVVTVTAADRCDEARRILRSHGASSRDTAVSTPTMM